jgi:hypothetical protein
VTEALARAGGPAAAIGILLLVLARPRALRLPGLALLLAGAVLQMPLLAPAGNRPELAAAAVVGIVLALVLAAVFHRWPWAFLLLALAAVPARIPVTIGETSANLLVPMYALLGGGALALAWELATDRPPRARELGALALPLSVLAAWLSLSLAWSEDVREGAIELLFFIAPFALLAVLVSRLPWSVRGLKATYALLAAMTVVFAAVGIGQWIARDVFWNPKVIVGNELESFFRVNSLFWDPSIYGRFLVVGILATLVLVLLPLRWRWQPALVLVVAVAWVGLLFSFSQSSFVALVAGVAVAATLSWRWKALVAVGLVAAVMIPLGATAPQLRDARESLFASGPSLDHATGGRGRLVSNGIGIALDNPLVGVGLGGFKEAYAQRLDLGRRAPPVAASHTTPVTVAAEAGFPGLALWVWLVLAAAVAAFRDRGAGTLRRAVAWSGGLAFVAIAVSSLFYNAFFEDPLLWGALGLTALSAARREGT